MGLLRLAVLGPPEIFHDSRRLSFALRKAQALLLYLGVQGGMHSRSKLATFLWPDSESSDARRPLRNAMVLLRSLLADPNPSTAPASLSPRQEAHLLSQGDLIGLNPQAPLELDLDVVQQAYTAAQRFSTPPSEPQRDALVSQVQQALALVRGPFLDGFWLSEETAFDTWHEQQQQQWQVRVQLLCERLSAWQEAGGELEQARATLTRWLELDPLAEEASQRLMRVHLARGDASAALQVYATCRARLAEELQVKPSPETVALAERIRATAAGRFGSAPAHRVMASVESQPPGELVAPLIGRAAAFSDLVASFQQVRGGQAQGVLVVGEAGIGKTRLAREFMAWARAQGAEVLSGHAFEAGGRLPYQPLLEALRTRLEAENAPEDLLEDLWLAELARLLPELRGRYPDLPAPTEDALTARGQMFEAVARLLDALAQRAPLVLLLDDLQWADGASLDLLRYLGASWSRHGSRVLLLGTLRREELEFTPQLSAQLTDLGRDLPLRQVSLQPLSQAQTLQLLEALVWERSEPGAARPSIVASEPALASERPLVGLGDFLFAQTGGQPLYLLETLKLLREREWLVPQLGPDGSWRLEPSREMTAALAQERSRRALLPPSVRAMIQARLAKLAPAARQLVMASAVLGSQASARLLWQLAELNTQAGLEALEEAVKSGLLLEEQAGGSGTGRPGRYRFAHDLIREVVYTELGAARRQVLHQRALERLASEGARTSELAYHARLSGEDESAARYSVQAGDEALAVFAVDEAIGHYEQARALLQEPKRIQTELSAAEVERLYTHLGQAYAFQNAWEKAQEAYEELLAYAQHQRQFTLASMTLNRLAILVVQQSNDKPQVQALLEDAWQMAQTSSDQQALAETEWNRAQITAFVWENPKRALPYGKQALSLARALHDQELETRCLFTLGVIHILRGDFAETMHCAEASLALYAALGNKSTVSGKLSLPSFAIGAPLTQPLTNRATEALCWALLAFAQVHSGQAHNSMRSGRRALALAQESKSGWVHVSSTTYLAYGLLEAGAYEEALELMQRTMALARTLPQGFIFHRFLICLGEVYHAMQQWEEARSTLEEAVVLSETLGLGHFRVSALSQLCMHYALAGQWEAAYRYAVKAIVLRKSTEAALIAWDFFQQYETEALLRGGEERQAREAVQRLGEGLGPNHRFRLPYLRSLAVLAAWEGNTEQAIDHLREAAGLAAEFGLPAEQWQIQERLGRLYQASGEQEQARTAFGEATRIILGLAGGIGDEALRTNFLAGPQIQPLLQQGQREASPVPNDHAEPNHQRPHDLESEKDVL
jgi:predicted ATPase/DNA-binding SARP family transcriptional activator